MAANKLSEDKYKVLYDEYYINDLFLDSDWIRIYLRSPMFLYYNGLQYKLYIPFEHINKSIYVRMRGIKSSIPVELVKTYVCSDSYID
jgi:hypothetical protein